MPRTLQSKRPSPHLRAISGDLSALELQGAWTGARAALEGAEGWLPGRPAGPGVRHVRSQRLSFPVLETGGPRPGHNKPHEGYPHRRIVGASENIPSCCFELSDFLKNHVFFFFFYHKVTPRSWRQSGAFRRHRKGERRTAQMTAVNSTVIIPPGASVLGDREFWRRNRRILCEFFFFFLSYHGLRFFCGEMAASCLCSLTLAWCLKAAHYPVCHQFPRFILPINHHGELYRPTKAFKLMAKPTM